MRLLRPWRVNKATVGTRYPRRAGVPIDGGELATATLLLNLGLDRFPKRQELTEPRRSSSPFINETVVMPDDFILLSSVPMSEDYLLNHPSQLGISYHAHRWT